MAGRQLSAGFVLLLLLLSVLLSGTAQADPARQLTATPPPPTATPPAPPPTATPTLQTVLVLPLSSGTPAADTVQAAAVRYEVSAGELLIATLLFAQLITLLVGSMLLLSGRHTTR